MTWTSTAGRTGIDCAAGSSRGISGYKQHHDRNTWTRDALEAGVPETAIVQMGGWGSVDMLRRYHGKLSTSELARYPHTFEVHVEIGQWCGGDNGVDSLGWRRRAIVSRPFFDSAPKLAEVAQSVEQWSEESRTPRLAELLGNSRLIPIFRLEEQWSQRLTVLSAAGRPHLSRFTSPLKEVGEWVERYRVVWEQRLHRMDEYLQALQVKEKRLAAWDS